ncbi:hypothetical protein AB0D35_26150 [Streptomyces sp. NPDC048301]|uniref:DUF1700 domain-containing protein n=1 Tax=Streptomyces sp. NPDC048301 TaxID=3155631 RepID=UPI00342C88F7
MNLSTSPSVQHFLAAVEREASALPADRRQELLADLSEHIDVALSERPGQEQAILAELGDPRTIATSALEPGHGPGIPRTLRAGRPGAVTALRVLLWILLVVAVLAGIGIASGHYPGPTWLQILALLPALGGAVHVFFLRPGRPVLRVTLTVALGAYLVGKIVSVARGDAEAGNVVAALLTVTMLVLLHLRSSRAWFAATAA